MAREAFTLGKMVAKLWQIEVLVERGIRRFEARSDWVGQF